ncbi:hypothetical protein QQS21_012784 [Conoideocrella luteorostrata]|uniref:Aminoglycoside phosphotransferase domain-containing protein n=1 Tax=Conoideocrella luteorostrata TaxID=1105319 RepID=A0AAJ0CD92_9HYPO|nr:hypothetical protein QQS21_012784 [Conoideocrella luteorostrata]
MLYSTALADVAIDNLDQSARLATLFKDIQTGGRFSLNHVDLGTQNILVDHDFNFVAIIDWEFAQAAPWHVNCYPMPFPLPELDIEEERRSLGGSFVDALNGPASKIYICMLHLPPADADLVRHMVQLAFGLDGDDAEEYIRESGGCACDLSSNPSP